MPEHRPPEVPQSAHMFNRTPTPAELLSYHDQARKVIARRGRRYRLSREEREDAGQEAYFWVLEAVHSFKPEKCCKFTSLLDRVIGARLSDFARRLRRFKSRLDRQYAVDDTCPGPKHADPADLASWQELHRQVANCWPSCRKRARSYGMDLLPGKPRKSWARPGGCPEPRSKNAGMNSWPGCKR